MEILSFKGRPVTYKRTTKQIIYRVKKLIPSIGTLLTPLDFLIPKRKDYWVFPVYFLGNGSFSDNILAVFNEVKDDPSIKKIVLRREKNIILDGQNVVVVPMKSLLGTFYLLRSEIIILQHSLSFELKFSVLRSPFLNKRTIINLWHGIAMKNISNEKVGFMNDEILRELPSHHIISSTSRDKVNMMKTFYKAKEKNFWITGLPRNDFLIIEEDKLSSEMQDDILTIREKIKDKKLFVYMPTYRDYRADGYYYDFSLEEINVLKKYLKENNAVFGFRYHPYNKPIELINGLKDEEEFLDLSEEIVGNTVAIIRESSMIITDYSSLFLDALYIEKRVVGFAYDYDDYMQKQHGFFYDYEETFPGDIVNSFDGLMNSLRSGDVCNSAEFDTKIQGLKKIFFKYVDDNNAQRVVEKVKGI